MPDDISRLQATFKQQWVHAHSAQDVRRFVNDFLQAAPTLAPAAAVYWVALMELEKRRRAGISRDLSIWKQSEQLGNWANSIDHAELDHAVDYPPRPGMTIGNHELHERIGEGGTGTVFRAVHKVLGRVSAVKVLRADKLRELEPSELSEYLSRFVREATLTSKLEGVQPFIVFDAGYDAPYHYLAMTLVTGPSVASWVQMYGPFAAPHEGAEPTPSNWEYWRKAVTIACGVADILDKVHSEYGILHRDVKPVNIVVADHDRPVLVDFGCARFNVIPQTDPNASEMDASPNHSLTFGTFGYMSPEQAVAGSKADIRTDIFGLGATLFFMLTGESPFDLSEMTSSQKLQAIQQGDVRRLRKVCPKLDTDLSAIVDRCLRKDPDERYASMRDLNEALSSWATRSHVKEASALQASSGVSPVNDQPLIDPLLWLGFAAVGGLLAGAFGAGVGLKGLSSRPWTFSGALATLGDLCAEGLFQSVASGGLLVLLSGAAGGLLGGVVSGIVSMGENIKPTSLRECAWRGFVVAVTCLLIILPCVVSGWLSIVLLESLSWLPLFERVPAVAFGALCFAMTFLGASHRMSRGAIVTAFAPLTIGIFATMVITGVARLAADATVPNWAQGIVAVYALIVPWLARKKVFSTDIFAEIEHGIDYDDPNGFRFGRLWAYQAIVRIVVLGTLAVVWSRSGSYKQVCRIPLTIRDPLCAVSVGPELNRVMLIWERGANEIGTTSQKLSQKHDWSWSPATPSFGQFDQFGTFTRHWLMNRPAQLSAVRTLEVDPARHRLSVIGNDGMRIYRQRLDSNSIELAQSLDIECESCAFSRNGRRLAAGGEDEIIVFDSSQPKDIRESYRLSDYNGFLTHDLEFSPDATMLASGHGHYVKGENGVLPDEGMIRIWKVGESASLEAELPHSGIVGIAKWSQNGTQLVTASGSAFASNGGKLDVPQFDLVVWDVAIKRTLARRRFDGKCNALLILPNPRYAACTIDLRGGDYAAIVDLTNELNVVWEFRSVTFGLSWIDVSPDERALVILDSDGERASIRVVELPAEFWSG